MSTKTKLELRLSELRTELREIAEVDDLTPELRGKYDTLKSELADTEIKYRAAVLSEAETIEKTVGNGKPADPETREREQLRERVNLHGFFSGAALGTFPPEYREYQSACGSESGSIPLDYFEVPDSTLEQRAVTPAPSSGTGVSLRPITPAVFSMSVAPALKISMPSVESGTYSVPRITTNQTAGWQAVSGEQAATAGAITTATTTPKRLSARLEIAMESIHTIGAGDFESALRQNLTMVLSDAMDKAVINGSGASNQPRGLISSLTAVTAEDTTDTWALLLPKFSDKVEGIFAENMMQLSAVLGVTTLNFMDRTFPASGLYPRESFGQYLRAHIGAVKASAQVPAAASDIQTGIICRTGRAIETAVMPRWGDLSITDIYSGSAKAETSYTMHVLVGDAMVLQPSAYALESFKLA